MYFQSHKFFLVSFVQNVSCKICHVEWVVQNLLCIMCCKEYVNTHHLLNLIYFAMNEHHFIRHFFFYPSKIIPLLRKQHAFWMILWYILQHNFYVSFYEQRSLHAGRTLCCLFCEIVSSLAMKLLCFSLPTSSPFVCNGCPLSLW